MMRKEPVTNTEKNAVVEELASVRRLWDMMSKYSKPVPVQVQFLEIESLTAFYIIFDILV